MTDAEKLTMLRVMVGESDSDELLSTYLTIAARKILNRAYPYDDAVSDVPEKYHVLQCEIAAYLINKRGAEGQTGHTENGITRQYEDADVPPSMLKGVTPHCGVFA